MGREEGQGSLAPACALWSEAYGMERGRGHARRGEGAVALKPTPTAGGSHAVAASFGLAVSHSLAGCCGVPVERLQEPKKSTSPPPSTIQLALVSVSFVLVAIRSIASLLMMCKKH
jgi:hypothetical protein